MTPETREAEAAYCATSCVRAGATSFRAAMDATLWAARLNQQALINRSTRYRVKRLQDAAARLIPQFAEAKIAEAWTGLRPGTPDNLPLLGATTRPATLLRPAIIATGFCSRR